jgi:GT2 family glycosyltransferase
LALNYNGWRYTVECLESLGHLRHREFWVVLVDNGSTDDSVDQIRAWARGEVPVESPFFKEPGWVKPVRLVEYEGEPSPEQAALEPAAEAPYVTLIRLPENRGFAAGNNVAIRYALARGAEWTWLLNNDTVVTPDSLTEMLRAGLADPRVGVVGCKLLYYDRPDTIQAAGGGRFYFWLGVARHYGWMERDDGRWDQSFEPHYVTGASMLVRAPCWQEVGLLDELFFFYGEEVDWQLEAQRHGYRTGYAPRARVYHREAGTIGRRKASTDFHATLSSLTVCRRYAQYSLPSAALLHLLRALRCAVTFQSERALAITRAVWYAGKPAKSKRPNLEDSLHTTR